MILMRNDLAAALLKELMRRSNESEKDFFAKQKTVAETEQVI